MLAILWQKTPQLQAKVVRPTQMLTCDAHRNKSLKRIQASSTMKTRMASKTMRADARMDLGS